MLGKVHATFVEETANELGLWRETKEAVRSDGVTLHPSVARTSTSRDSFCSAEERVPNGAQVRMEGSSSTRTHFGSLEHLSRENENIVYTSTIRKTRHWKYRTKG